MGNLSSSDITFHHTALMVVDVGLHGIHVHQEGGLGNGCKDAGGHFDPDQVCKISISIFAHFSFCIRPKMKPDFTLAIWEALNRWMVWQWLRWKTLD